MVIKLWVSSPQTCRNCVVVLVNLMGSLPVQATGAPWSYVVCVWRDEVARGQVRGYPGTENNVLTLAVNTIRNCNLIMPPRRQLRLRVYN